MLWLGYLGREGWEKIYGVGWEIGRYKRYNLCGGWGRWGEGWGVKGKG